VRTAGVWTVGQRSPRAQRRGRYLAESAAHPDRTVPDLARRAVAAFTAPGDVVVDPMCGVGTSLVEAAHLGRDCFGVEREPRWAVLAQGNLALARAAGAPGEGEVVVGDCRYLASLLPAGLTGRVSMVLASLPAGPERNGRRDDLGARRRVSMLDTVGAMLGEARHVLAPGGVVVVVARPWRCDGSLVDVPGAVVRRARAAGLRLVERDVALLVGMRDGLLLPRPSSFRPEDVRTARADGTPLFAHQDVLVFGRAS
jgi:modification methylase